MNLLKEYCCCCSVAQLYLTLCNPMDCSTPGLPVPHHLPKFAQEMNVTPRKLCISSKILAYHLGLQQHAVTQEGRHLARVFPTFPMNQSGPILTLL